MKKQVCLKRGEETAVLAGAVRIYDNEVNWCTENCSTGDVVEVIDSRQKFVAQGFFHAESRITVRVLTRDPSETVDSEFFRRRMRQAWEYRKHVGLTDACRVVFGDADGLPGLTLDKYGDYLSFQIVSAGMECWRDALLEIWKELFQPTGIYEKDDLSARDLEGLPRKTGCVFGEVPEYIVIREHDARMLVSVPNGQKTGHFLDQQENRGVLKEVAKGKRVLDLCSCSGGFAIHAGLYGAEHVTAVDASEQALELVRANAEENGLTCVETVRADVFDLLRTAAGRGEHYDVVILDPPAFAKSRKALPGAYRGYRELNTQAMRVVSPGGFLLTFSCSQFMTPELFLKMIREAGKESGRPVRPLRFLMQSPDHPPLLEEESSLYLKGWMLHLP